VDDASTRKGHKYGTVFLEISGKETDRGRGASKVARLLFFTPGKDKETFAEFVAELKRRGIPAKRINEIAMDMSLAFIAAAAEYFPKAQLCFDRFHVKKLCDESLDKIRKEVARENGGLPRHRQDRSGPPVVPDPQPHGTHGTDHRRAQRHPQRSGIQAPGATPDRSTRPGKIRRYARPATHPAHRQVRPLVEAPLGT
jgi:hypothetical protein